MFLFGLEGSGFIISLALTLLISGAIMFYCLKRFNLLENSIMEQGRVLQSFIVRAQQGGLGGQQFSAPPPGLATDIALKSAREQTAQHEQSKIEVSDDDEEGNMEEVSSSDVTSDSDSDDRIVYDTSEPSLELQAEEITTVKLDTDEVVMADPALVDALPDDPALVDALPDDPATVKIVSIEDIGPGLLSFNLESASESSETENDLIDELDIEQVPAAPLVKTEENKKPSLSKMRVDHLRGLVVESGRVTNMEAAKKLKKDDLLQMLQ